MLTLACIQTTEGWITVMWNSVDAVGQEMEPIINYNKVYVILYILLIILISLLFLNLFVGVVCETFNKEKENLVLNNLLQPDEKNFIQVQVLGYNSKPKPLVQNKP
jgi:hypothetical protein